MPQTPLIPRTLFHIRVRQRDSKEDDKKFLVRADSWQGALERLEEMLDDNLISGLNLASSIILEMSNQRLIES